MSSAIQGFLLGLAYVAPIGMQNLNVINSALTMNRWQALTVAWITVLFDILTCFVVTWMNPQALIDGSLLLGGMKTTLTAAQGNLFLLGVCGASLAWFTGLSLITNHFHKLIDQKVLKIVNLVCGAIVIYFGIKLFVSLYGLIPIIKETLS